MIDPKYIYEPEGFRFYDKAQAREMLLVSESEKLYAGWLCFRHPDGQWVTLRKATKEDLEAIQLVYDIFK